LSRVRENPVSDVVENVHCLVSFRVLVASIQLKYRIRLHDIQEIKEKNLLVR
jgi:hypothetical protein